MRILLDTHILIWLLIDDGRLSIASRSLIINPQNQLYFSAVSIAEMAIKSSKGKLTYPENISDILEAMDILELPLKSIHCSILKRLPFHHQDPFDRLIISQAISENMFLMSYDAIFKMYDVRSLL